MTLYLLSIFVIPIGISAPAMLRKSFDDGHRNTDQTIDSAEETIVDSTDAMPGSLDTQLDLDQIRLQRIREPEVILPPVQPQIQSNPPASDPVPVFDGRLIGTIIDDDPKYSFAVIQLPNSNIRLVRNSMPVDDLNPDITIHDLQIDRVVLMCGGVLQVLDLQVVRQ